MSTLDKEIRKEEEVPPTSEEAEIVSEHQNRKILQDGLLGRISDFITNSGCMDCNRKLEWELLFDSNDKKIATSYVAKHCRRLYSIQLESAGVRIVTLSDEEAREQVKEQRHKREHPPKSEDKKLPESEGKQADILKAQKDAETVSIHAEDRTTRRQAGAIADRLDQQTT